MMGLVVQKFGGSSVATAEKIKNVARRILDTHMAGNDIVAVVSARGDTTDDLIEAANQINPDPPRREMDMLLATGEQQSVALIAMAIEALGHRARSFTGGQVGIRTDGYHTKAKIVNIGGEAIRKALKEDHIAIVAGFQGVDAEENITTLGRGGSDLTAIALAAALKADMCEIFTDVDGVYTADPRIVPDAQKLDVISYEEMLELAASGAAVMQARSVEVAKKFGVKFTVRSSLNMNPGTLVCEERKDMEDVVVRGAAVQKDEAKITIMDVPDKPGQAAFLFSELAAHNINVDMIVQNLSREKAVTDITFTVPRTDMKHALKVTEDVSKKIGAGGVMSDDKIAKVSVVGIGMRSHSGVASKMFSALANEGINIHMISTSEIKISVIVDKAAAEKALRSMHKAFGLHDTKKT
jgi:aspartate kinase